ncbi:MAG: pilus assembly protein PilM [Candidatus Omnitrophica bacterium]|nr:pilus assembly protein PilM [Candidatus Omnitrophota bacterium]MBU4303540.1 pilus assembly protein PilM [Candidatus Omnitrophota bacterium]MBU4468399.1 pilus assembly protein PilM [Candidatus Omnitrophota bacterium]MCG2708392.1 pilus assembly protein PilM [Candidatus Omnitrophota bacterium]
MNSLGIYFGIKDINLVEASGNKILNNIRLPHPKLEISELEEKVPTDVKIMALLKDAFRSYRINADDATFCISGQDLVIRTFEIPLLPQSELRGAVSFEAKKYIPFKLEDLDYDFQVLFNKKNKTSLVLFVGIKKEILASYVSFAKQLNLKINALEYSAFSVLRFLKLAGFSDAGVIASLCFDLNNEDEASFTVFENGFSLFSRDFDFAGEPAGFEQTAESDLMQKQDKLKNEIRISFDYYKRKFPDKDVKNIFVVSDKESQQGLKSFFAEISIPVRFADTQKLLGRTAGYSSILVKSFAVALFKSAPLKIKINLIGSKLKASREAASAGNPFALLEGVKVDLKFIFLGVIVCLAVFGYGLIRTQTTQQELEAIKNKRLKISSLANTADFQELSNISSQYRKKIASLDNLVKNQMYVTPLLNTIPAAMPKGVWLESFNLSQTKDGRLELALNGGVYLEDGDQEFESVNIFITNLKKDPIFSGNFKEIAISFIDRRNVQNKNIAIFKITCKNFLGKK